MANRENIFYCSFYHMTRNAFPSLAAGPYYWLGMCLTIIPNVWLRGDNSNVKLRQSYFPTFIVLLSFCLKAREVIKMPELNDRENIRCNALGDKIIEYTSNPFDRLLFAIYQGRIIQSMKWLSWAATISSNKTERYCVERKLLTQRKNWFDTATTFCLSHLAFQSNVFFFELMLTIYTKTIQGVTLLRKIFLLLCRLCVIIRSKYRVAISMEIWFCILETDFAN